MMTHNPHPSFFCLLYYSAFSLSGVEMHQQPMQPLQWVSALHSHANLFLILIFPVCLLFQGWQGSRWSCSMVWPPQRVWLWTGLRVNSTGLTAILTRSRWPSSTGICAQHWLLEAWSIHGPSLLTQGKGTLCTNSHIEPAGSHRIHWDVFIWLTEIAAFLYYLLPHLP